MIIALIDEAVASGAGVIVACRELGITARTVQRWRQQPRGQDKRHGPMRSAGNALSENEWAHIRSLATAPEFVDLSPHQLVAETGRYGYLRGI